MFANFGVDCVGCRLRGSTMVWASAAHQRKKKSHSKHLCSSVLLILIITPKEIKLISVTRSDFSANVCMSQQQCTCLRSRCCHSKRPAALRLLRQTPLLFHMNRVAWTICSSTHFTIVYMAWRRRRCGGHTLTSIQSVRRGVVAMRMYSLKKYPVSIAHTSEHHINLLASRPNLLFCAIRRRRCRLGLWGAKIEKFPVLIIFYLDFFLIFLFVCLHILGEMRCGKTATGK